METQKIKQTVKERYGKAAETSNGGTSCCCATGSVQSLSFAAEHGLYSKEELSLIPKTALTLSKGCANPVGFANIKSGEVVVDFGCGAGIDVILATHKAGIDGKVVGVDFTPQMIEKAKLSVAEAKLDERKIEFINAELNNTTLPDNFADVIISNCVINLCPDKEDVYREAFRILKPGGRLSISDIVYSEKINPLLEARFKASWAGCVGGTIAECCYFEIVRKTGFNQIEVVARHTLPEKELEEMVTCPGSEFTPAPAKEDIDTVQGKVVSIKFTAIKLRTN